MLTGATRGLGAVLGERLLARLRERLVESVLNLPLGLVERAGTGDLLTRASTDVDDLSQAVRAGLPQLLVAAVTAVLATAALVLHRADPRAGPRAVGPDPRDRHPVVPEAGPARLPARGRRFRPGELDESKRRWQPVERSSRSDSAPPGSRRPTTT